ncbi:hypothetical protein COB52_00720 [Candidatus Kaiserbacteria bacterium]|nr:MAG: hypothetical protein COB52_00720 [Candidatus Kaiserbacteria bacterium]
MVREVIVYIPGILEITSQISNRFRKAFAKYFPETDFVVEECFYFPWQKNKMLRFADAILKEYDHEGREVILFGFSMGGVIATAIAPRFKKAKVRVITLMSPHTFLWGLFSKMLGSNLKDDEGISIISFRARFDWVVWWGARHPYAEHHEAISCDHLLGPLFSDKPAEKIAEVSK